MGKNNLKLWWNGQLLDVDKPVFTASDRGAALGDGLFETIKMVGGQACFFDAHWARFSASAKALRIPIPFGEAAILQGLCTLARQNAVKHGAARLVLSRGCGPRGLALPARPASNMLITISAISPGIDQPLTLGLSTLRRNPDALSCRHKTLSYADNIAARLYQQSQSVRDDVVMLDNDGHIACASAANLFWWDGATLYTPSLHCAILPGTMRARVLTAARGLGWQVAEGAYKPQLLLSAQAAFMTNALIGMKALAGVDFGPKLQSSFETASPQIQALQRGVMAL